MAKTHRGKNALLSYEVEGIKQTHKLWVMKVSQDNRLSGAKHQSRIKAHFYPRAHAPGNMMLSGRCHSQEDYQQLAKFIRIHHRHIINAPDTEMFHRFDNGNPGYLRLLRLSIPSENIYIRGWVDTFMIQKKGVFEPAPEFQLSFFIVFDHLAQNFAISHRIRQYYDNEPVSGIRSANQSGENREDTDLQIPIFPEITQPSTPIPGTVPDPRIPPGGE